MEEPNENSDLFSDEDYRAAWNERDGCPTGHNSDEHDLELLDTGGDPCGDDALDDYSEDEPNAAQWMQSVTLDDLEEQRAMRWPDFHPEDFCHRCGQRNPVWWTDAATWNMLAHPDRGIILCPSCAALAYERATGERPAWSFRPKTPGDHDDECYPGLDLSSGSDEWAQTLIDAVTAAGYRIVDDPDRLLPEGELRVFEAWPDVLPRWDVTLIVATPEPSP